MSSSKLKTRSIGSFPGQKENEIVQLTIRKHWFPHFKVLLNFMIAWIIPALIFLTIVSSRSGFFKNEENLLITIFFLLYLLFVGLILYVKWLNEELDVIIITDQRILSIDQISFFDRAFSETSFDKVEDVKARIKGICSNIFEFGSLEIQTAAEKILFQIDQVPKPAHLCEKISDIITVCRQKNGQST